MDQPTFLDRRPLGIANYLAIALAIAMLVALVPRGARMALRSNTNKVEDWLPAAYPESQSLEWFRGQFGSEAFILVSWEGCTLGDTQRLELLAGKLRSEPLTPAIARAARVDMNRDRRIFAEIKTGPEMLARLGEPPARLSREEAILRLEGALVGPPAVPGDDASRTTCLLAHLGPQALVNNRAMRSAIERLTEIAHTECDIPLESLHLGGPPVDNVAIDIEGERSLRMLAGLSGLVGLVLAYACFRHWKLTGLVLTVGIIGAATSLAIVFYYGAFEILVLGAREPRLGKLDAILMSMPAVVYVLGLSGAIHLVNYYRDACRAGGRHGAVERAVRMAWMPCGLASLTTAIGLASLSSSDILPIEKFGVFSALGVLAALVLLFAIVPVVLHRFPPPAEAAAGDVRHEKLPRWARGLTEAICRRHAWVAVGAGLVMVVFACGLPRIESSVQLLKLLDSESDLVQDYTWLEQHLGNLVPMEVVVAVPAELRRGVNEHSEQDGQRYRMTTFERLMLIDRVARRIEALEPVSRVLDASTFSPSNYETTSPANRRTHDYVMSQAIDKNRGQLAEYLRWEPTGPGVPASEARELWRASARIAALADIDYGEFIEELKRAVEPVLALYRARSGLVAALADKNKQLAGGQICFVATENPTDNDRLFAELLLEAGVNLQVDGHRGRLWVTNLERLREGEEANRQRLAAQDAVVALDPRVVDQLEQLGVQDLTLLDFSAVRRSSDTPAGDQIAAVYTGVVPVVYKTQRELLVSLQESLALATVLIALVLVVLLRSIGAGLASMIPNLFPLVVVFGALGWLGIPIDIGIMMTASVALGVAVDDTIHFVSWFRRGLSKGLSRHDAALEAYERCGLAMLQTTLIAGLGLAVFAFSTFTPTEQFGYLMVTILTAAVVGDLVFLPALLVGPLGGLFSTSAVAARESVSSPNSEEFETNFVEQKKTDAQRRPLPAPSGVVPAPHRQPAPAHESLSPANAALQKKLRSFRRSESRDR